QDFPEMWSRYHRALVAAAHQINAAGNPSRRVRVYFDCGGHTDTEDYQRLMRDIEARQLAGLMFAFAPHALAGTPLMEEVRLPRVAAGGVRKSLPIVRHDTLE